MKYLHKISQFLYFQIACIFVVLIYMYSAFPQGGTWYIIYILLALLLLPLIDTLINSSLSPENKNIFRSASFISWLAFLLLGLTGLYLFWVMRIEILLLSLIVFLRYYKFGGRIFFISALIIFAYVALSLSVWNNTLAELLSIYAYYFLIAWVMSEVLEKISFPKGSSHA